MRTGEVREGAARVAAVWCSAGAWESKYGAEPGGSFTLRHSASWVNRCGKKL